MQPKSFSLITALFYLSNLISLYLLTSQVEFGFLGLLGFLLAFLFTSGMFWCFWQGQKWARWLLTFFCLFTFLNLIDLASVSALEQAVIIFDAVVAIAFLVWVNTNSVRAYFNRS